jgi:hypothetical protein
MTLSDARRIVRCVSKERGPSAEYPDVPPQYPSFYPLGHAADHSNRDVEQIAEGRSREDEALKGHKKPSLWKRLFSRRRGSDAEEESTRERPPPPPSPGPGSSIYPGV